MLNTSSSPATDVGYVVSHRASARARAGYAPVGGLVKRAFDIVLSGLALVVLAPMMLGFAVAIKMTSRGPALYGHTRIGFDGRRFKCWKFRSMVTNGPEILARHLRDNPAAQREWDETQKLRDDPRVTPLGRVLRALSIDELPQLLNILAGDMSIVGPRPIMEKQRSLYPGRAYYAMRPGITGLWQVSDRNRSTFAARATFDADYHDRLSIGLDLRILWKTLAVVLRGTGC